MTTRPTLPQLDYTLACCPACGHEAVQLAEGLTTFHTINLSLWCNRCDEAESVGHVTRRSRFLSAAVMRRWGVAE